MPIVEVTMLEGRLDKIETRKELLKAITDAVSTTLKVEPESIHVILHEVAWSKWSLGGRLRSEITAHTTITDRQTPVIDK
jgi:4-oxalocrotonate tautomerase